MGSEYKYKFDLCSLKKTPETIDTEICTGYYVWETYSYAKFHHDTISRFCPPPQYAKMRIE